MSKPTSPHAYTVVEVDYEASSRCGKAERDSVEGRGGLQPHLPAVHLAGR